MCTFNDIVSMTNLHKNTQETSTPTSIHVHTNNNLRTCMTCTTLDSRSTYNWVANLLDSCSSHQILTLYVEGCRHKSQTHNEFNI